jgi:hypothetical protein
MEDPLNLSKGAKNESSEPLFLFINDKEMQCTGALHPHTICLTSLLYEKNTPAQAFPFFPFRANSGQNSIP